MLHDQPSDSAKARTSEEHSTATCEARDYVTSGVSRWWYRVGRLKALAYSRTPNPTGGDSSTGSGDGGSASGEHVC
jgi:hypothetical protein